MSVKQWDKVLKLGIYQDGRYLGRLLVKDRWYGFIEANDKELRDEVERRLPTLVGKDYAITFE